MADFRHNEDRLEKLLAIAALVEQTGRLRETEQVLQRLRSRFSEVMTLPDEVAGAAFPWSFVTAKARALTRADGAALALDDGVGMLCVARAGDVAPEIAAELDVNSGLSGECVRTAAALRCGDTESDERVSRTASRELGVRSMAVVPVEHDGKVCGILEVFSRQPNAFSEDDVLLLRFLARQVRPKPVRAPLAEDPASSARFRVVIATQRTAVWAATTLLLAVLGVAAWLLWPRASVPLQAEAAVRPADGASTLQHAAERGEPQAQFELAMKYASAPQDTASTGEAVRWFTAAAEQGHLASQRYLSLWYWERAGEQERDAVKAYGWAAIAAAGGDEASLNRAAMLRKLLNADQLKRGEEMAAAWQKTRPQR